MRRSASSFLAQVPDWLFGCSDSDPSGVHQGARFDFGQRTCEHWRREQLGTREEDFRELGAFFAFLRSRWALILLTCATEGGAVEEIGYGIRAREGSNDFDNGFSFACWSDFFCSFAANDENPAHYKIWKQPSKCPGMSLKMGLSSISLPAASVLLRTSFIGIPYGCQRIHAAASFSRRF